MKFKKEDDDLYPCKDWADHSPLLWQLQWSNRLLAHMIQAEISLYGRHDSNRGGWLTSKKALMKALMLRNQQGMGMPVDLDYAYANLSPVPLLDKV